MFDVVGDKKNYHNIQYNTKKKELDKVSKIVQKAENTGYHINKEKVILENKKFVLSKSQFGKKASKHMKDYGLDIKSEQERDKFKYIIYDIVNNHE
ncbi:MAG: hypothetical protein Q4E02_00815 [Lagierella massiliensis]|nr:hypothetical protein [Lagierella massiliensis]